MKVREAMTTAVSLTSPDRSIREAAELMARQDIGALPVGEDDRLIGMITDRDIAVRAVAKGLGRWPQAQTRRMPPTPRRRRRVEPQCETTAMPLNCPASPERSGFG